MVQIGDCNLGDFPIILAPMEDITDPPFRSICKENGCDLMFSEFASADALVRDSEKTMKKLDVFESERPVAIQIFGSNAQSMALCAQMINNLEKKPDFIDINWGCPVSKVVNKEAGSGILRNIPKMVEITRDVVRASKIPVTIKTRIGWDSSSINIMEVSERLQDQGIAAISIHGRTRCQMYKGQADWKPIAEVKNNPRIKIPVFGNGDVTSVELVKKMCDDFGLDGCMIGRAAIGNPWIFSQSKNFLKNALEPEEISLQIRIETIKKHLKLAVEWKGEKLGILETRKHYAGYFKNIPDFKQTRLKLSTSDNIEDIFKILDNILV